MGGPILYQFKIIFGKTQKYIPLGGELLLGIINLLQIKKIKSMKYRGTNLFIVIIWIKSNIKNIGGIE